MRSKHVSAGQPSRRSRRTAIALSVVAGVAFALGAPASSSAQEVLLDCVESTCTAADLSAAIAQGDTVYVRGTVDLEDDQLWITKAVSLVGVDTDGEMATLVNGGGGRVYVTTNHPMNDAYPAVQVHAPGADVSISNLRFLNGHWRSVYVTAARDFEFTDNEILADTTEGRTVFQYNILAETSFGLLLAGFDITGSVFVARNHVNLEMDRRLDAPRTVPDPIREIFCVEVVFTPADVVIVENRLDNCSARALLFLEVVSRSILARDNEIHLGSLLAYHLGGAASSTAIGLFNGFFDMGFPVVSGPVVIEDNDIVADAVDQEGFLIGVGGYGAALSAVTVRDNRVELSRGYTGLRLASARGVVVEDLVVEGSAEAGVLLASSPSNGAPTTGTELIDIDLASFRATADCRDWSLEPARSPADIVLLDAADTVVEDGSGNVCDPGLADEVEW